jgi:hypothetical protein
MPTNCAFWRNLEFRFRELLNIPEAARLTGMYCNAQWGVHGGPRDQRNRARLHQLFTPLARAGAIAAGAPNGVDALDVWLNLLWTDTPDSHAIESHHAENGVWVSDEHQGGWIQNLVLVSADYCVVRSARAFESETTTAVAGVPVLPGRKPNGAAEPKSDESNGKDAGPTVSGDGKADGMDRRSTMSPAEIRQAFVRPILTDKGWSIHDWADKANVDFHTANEYLKGTTNPYASTRKKLADSLGVAVADLPA